MANKIQLRRDTAANWTSVNPVLDQGEPGLETDTNKIKYGDGATAWNALAYASTGGSGGRKTVSVTTSSLAANASFTADLAGAKGYALYSVQVSTGAWVTIYSSTAARTADSGRSISTDPVAGNGIVAEMISSGNGSLTQLFTPATIGFNAEPSPTTNIPVKIVNNSGTTASITVTLTYLPLEV